MNTVINNEVYSYYYCSISVGEQGYLRKTLIVIQFMRP